MPGINSLNQIRQAFRIPDSVVIISGASLFPPKSQTAARQQNFQIDQTITADPELYRSTLGTPVFTNIQFLAGRFETNTMGVFKDFGPMTLDTALITVSQTKKIIKTGIVGRDGSAKEYIGLGDYEVTINGIITGANGHYPIDEVAALKRILDAPMELAVASSYLMNLGITSLVIETYVFSQNEGGYSYQTFSINCSSDTPSPAISTNRDPFGDDFSLATV